MVLTHAETWNNLISVPKNPEKYMKKLEDQGVELEDTPKAKTESKGHEHHGH